MKRQKTLTLATQLVAGWIKNMSLSVDLPEDIIIIGVKFDPSFDNVVILLESEEFPEIPEAATPEEIT